jgi:hypothetical protein
VELYDLQGRHAAGWRRQLELARGVHVVNLETAALPSGTYFVRVSGTVGASPVREILKVTRIR